MFSSKVLRMVLTFVSLTCFAAGARAQATWYVDDDASSGGDGTTWATAYDSLSTALTAAQSGDQIWVAAGTYVGNFTLALGVEVYGGFVGTETEVTQRAFEANPTILDGNRTGSVVTSPPWATEGTRIDGFTITNGSGTVSGPYIRGGGLYLDSSSPTIANNTITGNNAAHGGGLYLVDSSPTIVNNTIMGNIASSHGGGLYLVDSSPTIANSTITGNTAFHGSGLYLWNSSPTIANSTITGNGGPEYGSALYLSWYSSPTIANTIVAFNSSYGIVRDTGTPTLRHNCVYGNAEYDYYGLTDPTGTHGNISADPRLADPAYGNVHIQPDSPCADAGSNADAYGDFDMDGEPRTQGGTVDIGADESDGTEWPAGPYVVVRVSPMGDDGNHGLSWAFPKGSVQAGIDAASALGGEVWVQAGTYYECVTLPPYVYLYGGFAGGEALRGERDWGANVTTIDGQRQGSVVTGRGGYRVNAIDGFTITNGSAEGGGGLYMSVYSSPTIANNTIIGNSADYHGGGLYLDWCSSPTIANNTIIGNSADYGGGLSVGRYASPTIADNTITGNRGEYGGGLYLGLNSSPTIANNTITSNNAEDDGGGMYLDSFSSPTIANNTITGNSADDCGGGLYLDYSSPTVANNTITGNSAVRGGGLYLYHSSPTIAGNMITGSRAEYGGGLFLNYYSHPTIANNTITQNIAGSDGGGLGMLESYPRITNNTITGSGANDGGGLFLGYDSSPTIANTIVAFNSSGLYGSYSSTPTLRHNCVYGNAEYDYYGLTNPTGTAGNISADPLFAQHPDPGPDGLWGTADDDLGDLQLSSGSPCIDAGDNDGVPPDTPDLDGDSDTEEPLPLDLAGGPRFLDDPTSPDTGNPGLTGPPIVDMGAYEYVSPCGNGVVDPGEECEPPGSECCDAWCHFVFFVFGACCFDHVICVDNTECYECGLVGGRFLGGDLTCDGDPDGDGAFGCEDGCPVDPYKTEPGICGCGIPDADTDGDAVPDCIDLCPDTPVGVPVNSYGCPALGACCFPVGVCWDDVQPDDCAFIGGTYQGDGSTCYIGCLLPGRGDVDGDNAVDLDDFVFWAECAAGPYHDPYPEACEPLDFNWDGDVDMADFARFQVAFSSVFCQTDADCDDGLFCNGDEVCDTQDGCVSTGDPCPPDTICNEDTDTCGECEVDADCADDLWCNGSEMCVDHTCQSGNAQCEDAAHCDEDNDACLECVADGECDDDDRCTSDACVSNECQNTAVECGAGEVCDPDTGQCVQWCSADPDCDDDIGCTIDDCDELNNRCVNAASDARCPDDGLWCNSSEYCNPVFDCTSFGSPCQPDEICNEEADECEIEPATWGSMQLLFPGSPGYKGPERYELDGVRNLVVAHLGLSEATLRETWPNATIEVFATDVPLGVETDIYRVVDDLGGGLTETILQTVTVNTFHLSFRGSTATWEFDYIVVNDVKNPFGLSVTSGQFLGEQTGEITGARDEITWTGVDGTFQRCEVGGECQTPTPLDWMLGTWTKE